MVEQGFSMRIGSGYDVHKLVPDRKLILCGVEVPYQLGLLGHSDADVALHALMDVYIMLSWLPSLFMELGFSRKEGSTAQFYFMVSATIGTIILGMLTDRWKKAYVIILMYGGILAGLFALNGASSLTQMYWASALVGAFVIGCQGVLYAFGGIVYPTELRGTGVGVASAVGRVGAMLGPAVAGQLLAAGFGAAGVISAAIPCIIISAIFMLFLVRRLQQA